MSDREAERERERVCVSVLDRQRVLYDKASSRVMHWHEKGLFG